MHQDKPDITAFFTELAEVFSQSDLQRYRDFYLLPCLMVTETGTVPLVGEACFTATFHGIFVRLLGDNFAKCTFHALQVASLAPTLTLATMCWKRYRTDGSLIEMLGVTYTLRQTPLGWRIVALVLHQPYAPTLP